MAKRGAEALAYRAPWESRLPHAPPPKRLRGESERRGPRRAAPCSAGDSGRKRKRAEEETEAAGGKRPAPAETSAPKGAEAGAASPQVTSRLLPEKEAASGRDLDENDVWHYNSFQYWRIPLPTIDLSDILDLKRDDTVEARDSSNIGFPEMET